MHEHVVLFVSPRVPFYLLSRVPTRLISFCTFYHPLYPTFRLPNGPSSPMHGYTIFFSRNMYQQLQRPFLCQLFFKKKKKKIKKKPPQKYF